MEQQLCYDTKYMGPLRAHLAPVLLLLFLSPFLAEVLTGSTPLTLFLNPIIFLLFVTAGYGFPVLIIRELFIRKHLGFFSLFVLGIAYGLWNEGLFAQTIFYPFHSPIESFGAYGLVGNIRIPFALLISFWHALYAVIYPILLVHYLFPAQANKSWISKKVAWGLGLPSFAFGMLGFFINLHPSEFDALSGSFTGNPYHFIFLILTGITLVAIAFWFPSKGEPVLTRVSTKKLTLYGVLSFCAVVIIPAMYANLSLPPLWLYVYFAGLCIYARHYFALFSSLSVRERMIIVCAGEAALAAFGTFLSFLLLGNMAQGVFVASCLLLFLFLVRRLHKKKDT